MSSIPETIRKGSPIVITDAGGTEYETEALSGVERRRNRFPVVQVKRPLSDGRGWERCPWPAEFVRLK